MDEKPAVDLSAVPLSALTSEIKRRMTEFTEAQHMMSGFIPGIAPAASVTKRAKHVSNNKKDAAVERWRGWGDYRAKHPGAKPKEFFAWKKRQK